ncbi:hypothetical protein [Gordonia sp. 852002-10350_SCH5691597]|uniref:hypothetical protein n=1 Tax=Gordonia sp. 852002-10350_SCH5691597 TaxID=1834085 RepID=UPI0007EB4786|nr:hypothetical protein [Gordonia sp. 852002-10350_SCH5691597]OBA59253.1 hypothetical protein A5777_05290 [Gordonia sp. 852002-10350_SCH5691597]
MTTDDQEPLGSRVPLPEPLRRQLAEVQRQLADIAPKITLVDSAVRTAIQPLIGKHSPFAKYVEEQNAILARSIQPLIDARAIWGEQLAAQQQAISKSLGPAFEAMRRYFLPPNLQHIQHFDVDQIKAVVSDDGIALYGVPRPAIAKAIIDAPDSAARRKVLEDHCSEISVDCRNLAENYACEAIVKLQPYAIEALDAFDAGLHAAAQSLAANLVESALNVRFGDDRYKYTPSKKNTTKEAYDEFTVREFIAFGPVWETYQQYFVRNGDPVPETFSRNATAHTVDEVQYTKVNAVQGLMIACALLYRLDEENAALEQTAAGVTGQLRD